MLSLSVIVAVETFYLAVAIAMIGEYKYTHRKMGRT
jgi:hypothetical protein